MDCAFNNCPFLFYYDRACLIGISFVVVIKNTGAGESKRKFAARRYISAVFKTEFYCLSLVISNNFDRQKGSVLKLNQISRVNPQICRTEDTTGIKYGISSWRPAVCVFFLNNSG